MDEGENVATDATGAKLTDPDDWRRPPLRPAPLALLVLLTEPRRALPPQPPPPPLSLPLATWTSDASSADALVALSGGRPRPLTQSIARAGRNDVRTAGWSTRMADKHARTVSLLVVEMRLRALFQVGKGWR